MMAKTFESLSSGVQTSWTMKMEKYTRGIFLIGEKGWNMLQKDSASVKTEDYVLFFWLPESNFSIIFFGWTVNSFFIACNFI